MIDIVCMLYLIGVPITAFVWGMSETKDMAMHDLVLTALFWPLALLALAGAFLGALLRRGQ